MNRRVNGFPALVFWSAVWYLAARLLDNPLLLPTPVQVLRCLGGMMVTAAFWQTAAVSTLRILLGVVCAIGLGTVLAVLEPVVLFVLLVLCSAYLVDGSFNPFLYFRF